MPRLGAALASNGEVGQVLLQGPADHLVHDLGEVPVTGSGVQPERPMHGGIEVDGGTTSGGHTQRVAVNVKASKRYFKFLVKGLQSVSCLIGFGVASGGLTFNFFVEVAADPAPHVIRRGVVHLGRVAATSASRLLLTADRPATAAPARNQPRLLATGLSP